MNLEEEFQQSAEVGLVRVKHNLDRLGMGAVVAIGGVLYIAAGIADAGLDDARQSAHELLHTPKTAASQDRSFSSSTHLSGLLLACYMGSDVDP
jgi:hypothetical protein